MEKGNALAALDFARGWVGIGISQGDKTDLQSDM
jgi:hypothetical protein